MITPAMKISDRAKQGFDQVVQHCMRTTLVPAGQTAGDIVSVDAPSGQGGVVMLTVASSSFSLVLFLHYETDAQARARMATWQGRDPHTMTDQEFEDGLAETGNLFCGALNRELGRVFPLVAMSTPNRLNAHCIQHLGLLPHGHLRHFSMGLDDGSCRRASYCVCAHGDVDFVMPALEEEVATGELEFF